MPLKMDLCGIEVELNIEGYVPSRQDNWDDQWCKCDFAFTSGEWLNYRKRSEEVLLSCEVEKLANSLTMLLEDGLEKDEEIPCIEPDFIFTLYPQKDLRNDPRFVYVAPGHEIQDIYVEWKVYFWHEGLTDNFLTVTLCREDIVLLRDYLVSVIQRKSRKSE